MIASILSEALESILQRPWRTLMEGLGILIGVASFVAVTGVASTADSQVSQQFTRFSANQVTVTDSGDSTTPRFDFPINSDQRVRQLPGVASAGTYFTVPLGGRELTTSPLQENATGQSAPILAATPGLFRGAAARMAAGAPISTYEEDHHAAVIIVGGTVAEDLGLTDRDVGHRTLYIGGEPFLLAGIVASAVQLPAMELSGVVPLTTALRVFGAPEPTTPAAMLIQTRVGAAQRVAAETPLALSADHPGLLSASAPPTLGDLQHTVVATVNGLSLILPAAMLILGALSIANVTLVAVFERTPEFGLRRAMGALPRHITMQILAEAGAVGAIGGLVGTGLAVPIVVITAVARQWTAVISPWEVFPAPLVAALVGVLAGIYPAYRAATIQPADALRR